jgi:hypothetical protein
MVAFVALDMIPPRAAAVEGLTDSALLAIRSQYIYAE